MSFQESGEELAEVREPISNEKSSPLERASKHQCEFNANEGCQYATYRRCWYRGRGW